MWRSLLLAYVTQLKLIDVVVIKTFTSSSGYFIVWLLKYERAGCLFRMNGFLTFNYSWQQNPALPRAISCPYDYCVSELQRFWSAVMTSLIVGRYLKTISLLSTGCVLERFLEVSSPFSMMDPWSRVTNTWRILHENSIKKLNKWKSFDTISLTSETKTRSMSCIHIIKLLITNLNKLLFINFLIEKSKTQF